MQRNTRTYDYSTYFVWLWQSYHTHTHKHFESNEIIVHKQVLCKAFAGLQSQHCDFWWFRRTYAVARIWVPIHEYLGIFMWTYVYAERVNEYSQTYNHIIEYAWVSLYMHFLCMNIYDLFFIFMNMDNLLCFVQRSLNTIHKVVIIIMHTYQHACICTGYLWIRVNIS